MALSGDSRAAIPEHCDKHCVVLAVAEEVTERQLESEQMMETRKRAQMTRGYCYR